MTAQKGSKGRIRYHGPTIWWRVGEKNKQKILDVVVDHSDRKEKGGIQPLEIAEIIKIDIRNVQRHLAVLLRERKIEKRKEKGHRREYCATDTYQVSKLNFAHKMRLIRNKMIYSIYRKPRILTKDITRENIAKNPVLTPQLIAAYMTHPSPMYTLTKPEVEFYETMSHEDITISSNYCQTKFSQIEIQERYMFEFVNRVGAFIVYILIEYFKALSGKSNDYNTKLLLQN
jgi:DNA-binding transcriptional ArsR family regulator